MMFDKLTQIFKGEPLKFIVDTVVKADKDYEANCSQSFSKVYEKCGILILASFVAENTALFNQVIFSFKSGDLNGVVRYEIDGFDCKFVSVEIFRNDLPLGGEFYDWFIDNDIDPLNMNDYEKSLMDFNGFN